MAKINGLGYVIILAVLGILIAAFAQQISNSVAEQTGYLTQLNESKGYGQFRNASADFSVSSNASTWIYLAKAPTATNNFSITNVVVALPDGTVLTLDTDYQLDANGGAIRILNSSLTFPVTNNLTLSTYGYQTENYIDDNSSRNLTDLIPLLFIVGCVIVFIGYQWKKGELGELLAKFR